MTELKQYLMTMFLNRDQNDQSRLEWSLFDTWLTVGRSFQIYDKSSDNAYVPQYIELSGHQLSKREIGTLHEQPQLNVGESSEIVVRDEPGVKFEQFREEDIEVLKRLRGNF